MKVLFAVSNEEISESIVKKYQKEYKKIISYKNVYYFNAILKELQKDKSYDRIVISEDLEAFTHNQYDQIDKFIFEKLDAISDEAANMQGNDIPIILICSDRRTKSEEILVKLFGIGVYNAIIGNDRSVDEVCKLINRPRSKKEAKTYYNIDSEDVNYQAENENDVSEMEIQNIVAHYKRLGKNEDRYIDSFNNIAAQYNDTQLRIISKFLPLNVRAVLEEKSPKYQQIMSFNSSVSNNLRYKNKKEEKEEGTSEKLLMPKDKERLLNRPVVIPSAVNMNSNKKLARVKPKTEQIPELKPEIQEQPKVSQTVEQTSKNVKEINEAQFEEIETPKVQETQEEVVVPVKKKRGRPRKNPLPSEQEQQEAPKKKRGRPRKNPIPEEDTILPGLDEEKEEVVLPEVEKVEESVVLPGIEEVEEQAPTVLPGIEEAEEQVPTVLPGIEEAEEQVPTVLPGIEEEEEQEPTVLPGVEKEEKQIPTVLPGIQEAEEENILPRVEENTTYVRAENRNVPYENTIDIESLLTQGQKIVTFVGTSKNGTSFIVNNLAEVLSSEGINTAILDTTKNRNSYYIYTKNEEQLRNVAMKSIDGLAMGVAQGIKVNQNLTVYTSLPNEGQAINNVDKILETLVQNHTLILIDTDFETSMGYFKQSQETYLVQTLDVLTIQPLTAFLRELKAKNILDEKKLRIVLNKVVKIRGVTDKTIIGGMAYYNDPAMSFMTELFDRNTIKYVSIPFEEETYTKYLENIIECNISLKGYSKMFMQTLRELANMVYPIQTARNKNGKGYRPPSVANYGANTFTPNMNNTLDQMKRNY